MNLGDLVSRAAAFAGCPGYTDAKGLLSRQSFVSFVQQRYKELYAEINAVWKRHTFTVVGIPSGTVSLTPGTLTAGATITLDSAVAGAKVGDKFLVTGLSPIEGRATLTAVVTAPNAMDVTSKNNETSTVTYLSRPYQYYVSGALLGTFQMPTEVVTGGGTQTASVAAPGVSVGNAVTVIEAPIEGTYNVSAQVLSDGTVSATFANTGTSSATFALRPWSYTASRQDYALPTDYGWCRFARWIQVGYEGNIERLRPEDSAWLESSPTGVPSRFSTEFLNTSGVRVFRLYPSPGFTEAGATCRIDYVPFAPDLNGDTDVPGLPEPWHDVIARGAAADALMAIGNDKEASFQLSLWQQKVNMAKVQAKISMSMPRVRVIKSRRRPWR